MILTTQICEELRILKIFYLIKNLINIIKVIVPIILILMCSIDLIKNIIFDNKNNNISIIIKRLLYAVIIFFVPTIINFSLNIISNINEDVNICWNNSNEENINELKEIERQKRIAQELAYKNAKKARKEKEEKEQQAKMELLEQIKTQKKNNKVLINDSDCMDYSTDGRVYVKNGTFYIPSAKQSGSDGTYGSGEKGLNSCFYERLSKLIAEARSKGYTVTISYGWRSYAAQVATFKRNGGNTMWAASPGGSRHGWGVAADLSYGTGALNWVHSNCKNYGLWFRLPHENWHIEPVSIQTY